MEQNGAPEVPNASTALAIVDKSASPLAIAVPRTRQERLQGLLDAFLRGRKASTLRAYAKDLDVFTAFLRAPTRETAIAHLLAQEAGEANAIALTYRNYLVDAKLGGATINRRMASLRALTKLARMLGLISWTIEIENVPHESYTDIFGPGAANIAHMIAKCLERGDAQGVRDVAIIRLLYDRGLRCGEVTGLDLEHYDPKRGISIIGKGKTQRVWYQLPDETRNAIRAWLRLRGAQSGPLFTALGDRHCGHRLTGNRIYAIVRELGEMIGVKARPHRLRHAAISAVLVETNGNVQLAQRFSRHANLNTLLRYDDARRDDALQAAKLVSATVPEQTVEDARALVAACGRGHVHEAAAIGKFCTEGECFTEKGQKLPIRKIAWRPA
jgi:integrase/recombinase XerC